jgi:hypothetical protein
VNIARAIGQKKNGIIHHGSALVGSRQQANLRVQIKRRLVDLTQSTRGRFKNKYILSRKQKIMNAEQRRR